MAAAAPPSVEECPVCHDDFTDPKILSCTHLVCRKCVLSWLDKGGNQAGCPLCRASILPQGSSGQDVAVFVDDLPTDIITKAATESRRVLNEKHVCVCDGTTKATSFCMQCSIKFCPSCCKVHKMIPATREHEIKQIATLTVDKLAASYQSSCAVHPGRQVEQFCSSHQELICLNCSTSTHRRCPDVEGIAGAAMVKRQRLKEQERELEGKKDEIQLQVCLLDIAADDGLAKFKAMKDKVKLTFDELRGILDKRCRDATAEIQDEEDEFLRDNKSQKSDLEKQRARCAALCSTVSRLASASDDPLLAMLVKLKSRLEDAELLCMHNDDGRKKISAVGIGDFFFDPLSSARLKILMAEYGQLRDPKQPRQPFLGGGAGASQSGGRVLAKAQLSPDLDLQIIQGDITQCAVDAIVNAANGRLKHDGGMAAAIVKAGGRCIQEESDELVAEHGELNDGEVVVTGAGTLPCSHVIHAVSPIWYGGYKGEEEALIQTVKSILKEAEKMKLTSVAIPAISCGIFHYPVARATSTIMRTIARFVDRGRDLSLQTVVLIDMGADPLRGFINAGTFLFGKRWEDKDTPTSAPP